MKKHIIHLVVLILIVMVFNGCFDLFKPNSQLPNLITFTATYVTETERYSRVILADYDDLQNYQFITDKEDEARMSFISPDKKKIIIFKQSGVVHNCDLWLYDIETDTLLELYDHDNQHDSTLYGATPIIWDLDSKGFYYWIGSSWGTFVSYYNLEDESIADAPGIVYETKGEDSLYIFSCDDQFENYGYYTIHRNGGQQFKIKNHYLQRILLDDRIIQSASDLNWNEKTKEFLFVYRDTTSNKPRISISNHIGSWKNEYTSQSNDSDPVWGPDNKIIFFDRQDEHHRSIGTHVLDITTGGIVKLSDLVTVDSASWLGWASY